MLYKKIIFRLAVLSVCLIVLVLAVSACADTSRVSLSPYVSVSSTGVSGKGTATLEIDWDSLKQAALGGVPSGGAALDDYNKRAADLENSISFVLNQTSGLSNGDSVTVTIVCEEKASIAYNIKMYESFSVKLDGFIKQSEIDLFEELEVSFSGVSPGVVASVTNFSEDEFLKTVTYTIDKSEGLMFGETVTVTASYSQELADSLGYIPLASVKTYKVDGVAYYPYTYSQYPSELLKNLTTISAEQVNDRWGDYHKVILAALGPNIDPTPYFEENAEDIQIHDPELLEIIVLSRRDTSGAWFGSYNYLFFVYKTVVNDSILKKDTEVYQCVVFSDIFVDDHGVATYSQWNTEKPQYERATIDEVLVILQKEYSLYDSYIISK